MAIEGGYGSAAQFQLMAAAAQQATGQIGRLVQNLAVVQGAVGSITFATRAFATLEQQLTLTSAVAEGTREQFKQMEGAVRDAALAMKFSATEGANALYFLASAGLSVQQSISALQGVMVLAQATLTDVGTAADTVANALAAFQLSANQSVRVANLFSAAIAQSQADIGKLAYSFRQVAPVAGAMGVSIEQATAALSVLYNVGLRGEQAGTSLRNIMVNLANPTKEAAEALFTMGVQTQTTTGKARDLFEMLQDLAKVNPNIATLKTLFGADALAGAQALINASSGANYQKKLASDEEFAKRAEDIAKRVGKSARDMRNELELTLTGESNTNSAFDIAAKQMNTLSGSFSTATNALNEFAIQLGGQLAPALRIVANTVTDMAVAFRGLSDSQKSLVTSLPLISAGLYGVYRAYEPLKGLLAARTGAGAAAEAVGALTPSVLGSLAYNAQQFGERGVALKNAGMAGAVGALGASFGSMQPAFQAGSRGTSGPLFGGQSTVGVPGVQTSALSPATQAFQNNILGFAGRALGFLGPIAAGIGIVAAVAPDIFNFLKTDRNPTSAIPAADLGAEYRRQAQSIVLTAGNPAARDDQLVELRKTIDSMAKALIDQNAGLIRSREMARGGAGATLNKIAPGAGNGNFDMNALQSILLGSEGKPLDTNSNVQMNSMVRGLRSQFKLGDFQFISADNIKELQASVKSYAEAKAGLSQILTNVKDVQGALDTIDAARNQAQAQPGYAESKQKSSLEQQVKDADKLAADAKEAVAYNFISQRFIQEFERNARAEEMALNQLRAKLNKDPIENFFADVAAHNYEVAKRVQDEADKSQNDLTDKFGKVLARYGDVSRMLSGADFSQDTKITTDSGQSYYKSNPAVIEQSVKGMVEAGGFSREQILARYDAVVKEAMDRLKDADPQTRSALERYTAAQRRFYDAALRDRDLKAIQDLRTSRTDASTNRQYVEAMRERLVSGQQDIYKQLVNGASEIDPGVAMQQGLRELASTQQNAQNQFRAFEEQFFEKFAPAGSSPERTAAAQAEFEKYRTSFTTSLKTLFQVQIGNLILEARSARAKALDTLRSNKSDLEAQQAQIAQELYTYTGDPQFLAEAITSDSKQAVASADRAIAGLRDRSRTLTGNIARLNASNGLDMPGVPEINVPQATQTFQTETVKLQSEANATLKSIEANTRAGLQTAANPGGTIGNTPGSLPAFARLPALSGDINDMVKQATAGTGIGEDYLKRLIQIESGGNPNASNKSGAAGLLQFMPKTAQAYGLTNPFDPSASISAGVQLSLDNKAYLKKLLGRDPTDGELYLGHQQGAGGAGKLLTNPNALATDVVGTKAVTQNGGTTDMTAGDFARRWTSQFGGNDNTTAQTKQQTAANVELTASQKDVVAQIQDLLKIDGDYSNKLPDLIAKMKDRGATSSQVAQVQEIMAQGSSKLVAASEAELQANSRGVDMLTRLKEAKVAYFNSDGMKSYNTWQEEGKYLDALGKSMERNGSVSDGMQYAMMKARHNVQTDFQLAGDGLTSFMDKGSGIISGLITGTEKNWKASVASMLQDISNVIMKALIMRALTGSLGGGGDNPLGGGGFLGSLFGGMGGGTNVGAGLDGAAIDFGADITSLLPSAKGNVFVNGVIPHSVGGVVGSKQYFPMAGGNVGSIAETGSPEAILPLQRGRGGRLGVEIMQTPATVPVVPIARSGGGSQVANQNNFQASFTYAGGGGQGGQGGGGMNTQQQRDMEREFNNEMESAFTRFVDKQSAPGGRFHDGSRKYA